MYCFEVTLTLCIIFSWQTIDISSLELVYAFTPSREEHEGEAPPKEPPITKLFTSSDGQWLAAINCFGDIYVFNLETQRWELCEALLV